MCACSNHSVIQDDIYVTQKSRYNNIKKQQQQQ